MTPKEKAQELCNKHYHMNHHCNDAKECALLTVNEILLGYMGNPNPKVKYWEEVKQEIEKL